MTVMGIDVGYGNLKQACRVGTEITTNVMPSGAAPKEHMPERMGGDADYAIVDVNGRSWAAGVDANKLQNWERDLHDDFPTTDSYMALYFAALLFSGASHIERLVTGLPVEQAKNATYKNELSSRLTGEFQVTRAKRVTVEAVKVIPQPLGAYIHLIGTASEEDLDFYGDARVLVIDPGFGSVDWVMVDPGAQVRTASAGTSPHATSMLLEKASSMIGDDHGVAPGRDRLDQAHRRDQKTIVLGAERVEIAPYLIRAAQAVCPTALTKMRQSLRAEPRGPDVVLLTGGGAPLYQSTAAEIFPKARIIVPAQPVLANALGFAEAAWRANGH